MHHRDAASTGASCQQQAGFAVDVRVELGGQAIELADFLDEVYTQKRIHSSLGYLNPMEFEEQWNEQQQPKKKKQEQPQVVQYKNRKKA